MGFSQQTFAIRFIGVMELILTLFIIGRVVGFTIITLGFISSNEKLVFNISRNADSSVTNDFTSDLTNRDRYEVIEGETRHLKFAFLLCSLFNGFVALVIILACIKLWIGILKNRTGNLRTWFHLASVLILLEAIGIYVYYAQSYSSAQIMIPTTIIIYRIWAVIVIWAHVNEQKSINQSINNNNV